MNMRCVNPPMCSSHAEADRGAGCVVIEPDVIRPIGFKDDIRSFQNVIRCGSVYCLGSPDPVRIVGVADIVVRGGQLAATLQRFSPSSCSPHKYNCQ